MTTIRSSSNAAKVMAVALVLALLALVSVLAGSSAQAQDSSTGRGQIVVSGTGSIAGTPGAPAVIVSAVSGKVIAVKAMVLASTGAGVVQFYDGATTSTPIASVYLAANTSLVIDEKMLGTGFATASGNALTAQLTGSTLTYLLRVQEN